MKKIISNMLGNGMKHPFSLLFAPCLFIMIHTASSDIPAGHAKIESPAILDSVTLLKSAKDDAEKLKYLDEINHIYMDNALLILTKFRYDIAKNRQDNTWCSPLHLSIRAVGCWHIRSATDDLLKIIDYKLDPRSIPVGGDMMEDYLHPVLRILIQLGIERETTIRAIANAETKERIGLLLWILGRLKGINERNILEIFEKEAAQYTEENQQKNIHAALAMLKQMKHVSDFIHFAEMAAKE